MTHVLVLIVAAVVAFGWWRLSLWLWPLAPCRLCGGAKEMPGSNKRRNGPCRRCGGTGKRRRLGARR